METRAEDYYDIPLDLLPTPNFANRPLSDISMLDGMTFMISSSSSSDDEEEDTTAQPRSSTKLTEWTLSGPEIWGTPKIMITEPSEEDSKPRSRSLGVDVKMVDRPRLRRRAQTAPPRTLYPLNFVPPQPRRAISARIDRSKSVKSRAPQQVLMNRSTLTVKRIVGNETAEHMAESTAHELTSQSREEQEPTSSFSRKARVQRTLKAKRMGTLSTSIVNSEAKRIPNSPNSMLSTPRELYGSLKQQSMSESLPSSRSRKRRSTTSISPKTRSPIALPDIQSRNEVVNDVGRDADLLGQKRVYLPGTICLEEHPASRRRDSVASTDPFDIALASKGNRFSDMVALDGIVMFFEDLGVVERVTEETLDKYWLHERLHDPNVGDERRPSITSVEETTSKSTRNAPSERGSKFSFSSTSSTASVPPSGMKRQRIRLRRLLSPALPGSAFLKTPASWGQQTENP